MDEGWILLKVTRDVEVAVRQASVHRVLDRHSPDYAAHASVAKALHAVLGLPADRSQPGVIVLMSDGACWYAGDAAFAGERTHLRFVPVAGDLFATSPPWCRGLLLGEDTLAFAADSPSLEGALG